MNMSLIVTMMMKKTIIVDFVEKFVLHLKLLTTISPVTSNEKSVKFVFITNSSAMMMIHVTVEVVIINVNCEL